jgi:Protein of unknown function (DUF3237)
VANPRFGLLTKPQIAKHSMPQTSLSVKHCFELRAQLAPAIHIGRTSSGQRAIVHVTGGTVVGSGINATLVPGGGDWLLADPDKGWFTLDVRIAAKTEDGATFYIQYVPQPLDASSGTA